jgi:lysophospholipase L1-like esterase
MSSTRHPSSGQSSRVGSNAGERSSPLDRLAHALAALIAAAVALTCATTGTIQPQATVAAAPPPGLTSTAVPVPDQSSTPARVVTTVGSAPQVDRGPELALPTFYQALHDLVSGQRADVRIVWLGDSHTAADFMTHEVRKRLQDRFGNGGPGFIRLGVSPYRHGRAKIVRKGKWLRLPLAPAKETPTDDGVFGLGGMRSAPDSKEARSTIELYRGAVAGEARYDISYRLPTAASGFEVIVDDQDAVDVSGRDGSGATIQHLAFVGKPAGEISIGKLTGAPELFSVDVRSGEPGVVLDTVGVDGARVATPLAWDGATWVAELARRRPALVVVSFGTNEVYQQWPIERYGPQYDALVARIRSAAPAAACLFLGPTDVMREGKTDPRVVEIDAMQRAAAQRLGCAFVSLFQMMGGDGAYGRWMTAEPSLAARDGVHLSRDGYELLGKELSELFLVDYDRLHGEP